MVKKEEKATGMDSNQKWCAALSYLLIGIIWYFVDEKMKKSDFVKFHVKQGIVLIAVNIIIGILSEILVFLSIVFYIIDILLLVLLIIGIINAVNEKKNELLVIGQFAKYLKF